MSSDARERHRRDADPVRAYPDGRVAYWTGGRPGTGSRVFERCGAPAAAQARAEELRALLAVGPGRAPLADATLDQMVQAGVNHMRENRTPEGSTRQYKSNWNTWTPDAIGQIECRQASIWHYTAIFDAMGAAGASEATVKSVARTIGTMIEWGADRGYFGDNDEPFGPAAKRKKIVEKARKRARIAAAERDRKFTLALCPKGEDIGFFAAALELVYPGYGARLVHFAFGSGLRICELLALRWDSIDLMTGVIAVDFQMDRYRPWPALAPPKGGKSRDALLWSCFLPMAADLVADALARTGDDHGWLFPRHRSKTGWADQAGKLIGEALEASQWHWTFHWLRHAFASFSLAAESFGGYGLPVESVQAWLGHAQLSTTQNMYVQRREGDDEIASTITSRLPNGLLL